MDEKFNSGNDFNSFNNSLPHRNDAQSSKPGALGDFSENINSVSKIGDSTGGSPFPMASKPKNFVVHLPDSVDYIPDFSQLEAQKDTAKESEPVYKAPSATVMFKPLSEIEKKAAEDIAVKKGISAPTSAAAQNRAAAKSVQNKAIAAKSASAGNAKTTVSSAASSKKPEVKKVKAKPEARKQAKEPYNFGKAILTVCLCLVFIAILTFSASTVALGTINDILAISNQSTDTVTVTIPEGAQYAQVFDILRQEGLIKQPFVTDLFCKFRNYHQVNVFDRETQKYKTVIIEYTPGVYYLERNMGVENMLESIMVSSSGNKDSVKLTFPEGWSVAKIFAKLEKYGVCDAEKLYANLDTVAKQYSFLKNIEMGSGRYLLAEGYLFPDTYDFYIGENTSSVIKKLFENFDSKWTEEYDERLKELGWTLDEAVTIASIIQREAKDSTEMDIISSVIHNRLKDTATFPKIGMDSTKAYIVSIQNDHNLFSKFYYDFYRNAYDTNVIKGLPPGPICNPGADALKAALYPADTDYTFFCHSKSGKLYLAKTLAEHQANSALALAGE